MISARNFHNIDEGAIISFREKAAAEFIVTTFWTETYVSPCLIL